jgi:hypothetical protein
MDVIVTKSPDGHWAMADLLGRDMGKVSEIRPGVFMIQPAGNAMVTLDALRSTSFASLDEALAAIEEHTRGQCRRGPP